MNRTAGAMLVCLLAGAVGMYGASNFRVRLEPAGGPEAWAGPAAVAPKAEPAPLPPLPAAREAAPAGPIVDPAVRPAALTSGALAVAEAAPLGVESVAETVALTPADATPKTLNWGKPSPGRPIYLTGRKVEVKFTNPIPANATVEIDGRTGGPATAPLTGTGTSWFKLDGTRVTATIDFDEAGVQAKAGVPWTGGVRVKLTVPAPVPVPPPANPLPPVETVTLALRLPQSGGANAGNQVLIAQYLNTPFLDPAAVPTGATPVKVYGSPQGTFLELRGQRFGQAQGLKFVVQAGADPAFEADADPVPPDRPGVWTYRLRRLPSFTPGATGFVAARAEFGDNQHVYSGTRVAYQAEPVLGRLKAPETVALATLKADGTANTPPLSTTTLTGVPGPVYLANVRKFRVSVTPPDANAQSILLSVDSPTPTKTVPLTDASKKDIDIEVGEGRDHAVQVAFARGDEPGEPRVLNLRVRTAGPVVESVAAPGFGQSNGVGSEKVQIRFNTDNPLDPKTVVAAGFAVGLNEGLTGATTRTPNAPDYDPLTNTVTLFIPNVVPGSYTIGVNKSVLDIYGNGITPAPGLADPRVYQTVLLTQAVDRPLASVSAGVTLQTGPPVEFPEYTKVREYPEGFNPGDKVETRVVRLYYTRDAHRIAQIVNREVKSYNRATVDVRRRAADRARDDAKKATEERQRLADAAIRAAQETRAAEAEVKNLQGRLGTARGEAGQAQALLGQRQIDLDQARTDLARAEAEAGPRAAADQALDDLRRHVGNLEAQQARLEADLRATPPAAPNYPEIQRQKRETDQDLVAAKAQLAVQVQASQTRAGAAVDAQRRRVAELQADIDTLRRAAAGAGAADPALTNQLAAAQEKVAARRQAEAQRDDARKVKEREEERLYQDLFRLEVAAAREDPDTYAPGKPESADPVAQCSISVIGEGLIQIRGPIKGLNAIRTMINLMDAPAGQVRVAMHTVQVNGERGDRMEKVVANIQRYLDHARFLTVQSSQMLRKAVTVVASRKALEAEALLGPNCPPADRDARYLQAFFGADFIAELAQLDSEFLKTGNKVLSLHSMDSTSLSAALFLMALAKNEVRREILAEFGALLGHELPQAEQSYYLAGLSGNKCDACCDKKQYFLAYNARFASLRGFFDGEVAGTDTLTPVQREFVRLAQIFKARMITEIQLNQRVYERSLLEERFTSKSYKDQLREASAREDEANKKVAEFQEKLEAAIVSSNRGILDLIAAANEVTERVSDLEILSRDLRGFNNSLAERRMQYEKSIRELRQDLLSHMSALDAFEFSSALKKLDELDSAVEQLEPYELLRPEERQANYRGRKIGIDLKIKRYEYVANSDGSRRRVDVFDLASQPDLQFKLSKMMAALDDFVYPTQPYTGIYGRVKDVAARINAGEITSDDTAVLAADIPELLKLILGQAATARSGLRELQELLTIQPPQETAAASRYQVFKENIKASLNPAGQLIVQTKTIFERSDGAFRGLAEAASGRDAAIRIAALARRPLDEKKLLDLLVDEMEDKFIELLEGTRAHTANVDNYLRAVTTALDDDFNTQFYLPSFRRVREASRYWDVTLGQIETTTILTNNRQLGKVTPAATFEFDLPKRNILITEGFQSAKALMDEYGALMADPTFLALGKLYSGLPTSGQFGGGAGNSAVRNVLPGLGSSPDETILAQGGPGRQNVGAALEALIPDPAIYKFETGTGYEIRPVLAPDGQAVVFRLDYLYTTDVREPVRADEKHLGRVKRHFISTDVALLNFELKEVSKYIVGLKASRTARGVPLLGDIPGVGVLFRPLPSQESALQENLIYSQATIFPTLFDLMGLRYAQAVADLDPMADRLNEFSARGRRTDLEQRVYDLSAARVDNGLRIPGGERRTDLYRPQYTVPYQHPNGYSGPGMKLRDGTLQEGYDPRGAFPQSQFAPWKLPEDAMRPLPPGGVYQPPPADPFPWPQPFDGGTGARPRPAPQPGFQPGPAAVTTYPPPAGQPARPGAGTGTTLTPAAPPGMAGRPNPPARPTNPPGLPALPPVSGGPVAPVAPPATPGPAGPRMPTMPVGAVPPGPGAGGYR